MSAVVMPRALASELEDDLTNAKHIAVMVQWIGIARDYIEGVQSTGKMNAGLAAELRLSGVWINDAEWGECESTALRHLHMSLETSIIAIENKVGLGRGDAK